MTEQSTALRLADDLIYVSKYSDSEHWSTLAETVAELRRLHAVNGELLEALQRSRAQWIHSVNAAFCLAAIARAEGNT
jgi:flagellar biosynthesis/type III secretory pathway chaperone